MSDPPEGADSATGTRIKIVRSVINIASDDEGNDAASYMDTQSEPSERNGKDPHSIASTGSTILSIHNTKTFNLKSDKYHDNNIFVHIERTDDKNIGRLHPMSVGHILHKKLNIRNIVEIKSVGRNRIKVQMKTALDANNLVKNCQLPQENLRAFIPNYLLEVKGIIRGVDTKFDTEYIKNNISCSSNITEIRRTQRRIDNNGKIEFVPKQTIIVSFEGNILPTSVSINSVYFNVEQFVGRVTQCFKCLKYGHVAKQCKSTLTLCVACGAEKLHDHECNDGQNYCIYCKTHGHISISKQCPHYIEQKKN